MARQSNGTSSTRTRPQPSTSGGGGNGASTTDSPAASATRTGPPSRGRRAAQQTAVRRDLPPFSVPPYHIVIEDVWPQIDGGRWPIKREVGDAVEVWADVYKEGHDLLKARVLYRREDATEWQSAPMRFFDNDRWTGTFTVAENARYRYTVEAYTDVFGSWQADLRKRVAASQDVRSELLEGRRLVQQAIERAGGDDRRSLERILAQWEGAATQQDSVEIGLSPGLTTLVERYPDVSDATRYHRELDVTVDRVRARFGAWYEIFPRSQGTDPTRSATFREAAERLPRIREMGFDVVYMTPIHPIGYTKRKGPNNSLVAGPNDPGSPYAIGSEHGGHTAIAPELGTMDDFLYFQRVAHDLGMELAMDLAIQASPDHPWVREHPEWFSHRPDGTIKYAENPPKKYEDIYPINFQTPDWRNLWAALRDVLLFWADRGVRIFRVDNPHTKPLAFWEWAIREVQDEYPDVIFLSEAFTRPKMMRVLAKAGFTQSYTYFTWRNTKWELTEYLTELTQTPMREYFRPNFFANTHDILPHILQFGGRPAFRMRLVLAATLSPTYGLYNGFELAENTPRGEPGTTVYYQDSEVYEHKVWDWQRPGNIVEDVTAINRIRNENPALQLFENLRFYGCDNDQVLFYGKATPDLYNNLLMVVNLDPHHVQSSWIAVPIAEWGLKPDDQYAVHDLLSGNRYTWKGSHNWVRLDPHAQPAHIFRVELPRR